MKNLNKFLDDVNLKATAVYTAYDETVADDISKAYCAANGDFTQAEGE